MTAWTSRRKRFPAHKNDGKLVKLDIDKHRQKMGMVFQHFNLFPHMTILDNMTLAPIQVKHMDEGGSGSQKAQSCWSASVWATVPTLIPFSSPAVRSRGSPSSGR